MDARDENGASWRKSSRSGGSGCVEVAAMRDGVAVRDSKAPNGPRLVFGSGSWTDFIRGIKRGQLDHL